VAVVFDLVLEGKTPLSESDDGLATILRRCCDRLDGHTHERHRTAVDAFKRGKPKKWALDTLGVRQRPKAARGRNSWR
jgi:hypothetical protein